MYVDILTAGPRIVVDVEASEGAGLIALAADTRGEAIEAVRQAIEQGDALIDTTGASVLVMQNAVIGYRCTT